MTIIRGEDPQTYTKINNAIVQDYSLSAIARAIWVDLVTRPKDWKILPKDLAKRNGIGRDRIYSALNELIEYGVCKRVQLKKKMENGRVVFGECQYFIYNERQNFPCPGFKYTDTQRTEVQETLQIIDSNKEKNIKNQPHLPEDSVKENGGGFPNFLKDIPNLPLHLAERLLELYTEGTLEAAVNLMKKSKTRIVKPFGWLRDCIQKGYKSPPDKEELEKDNRVVLRDCFSHLDGRRIGDVAICVGYKYIEFINMGGRGVSKIFSIDEPYFEINVRAHIKKLQEAHKRSVSAKKQTR